jgi:uncharacterized protein YdaU (DUF1376 family)
MADPLEWMPLHIAEYLADTGHLGTIEHGAYLLLLMHHWRQGSVPTDEGQLRKIARMSVPEWQDARGVILDFFRRDGDVLKQKRATKEREKATRLFDAKSDSGKAGAAARWRSDGDGNGKPNGKRMAEPLANECRTDAPSTKDLSSPSLRSGSERASAPTKRRTSIPEFFPGEGERASAEEFWASKERPEISVDEECAKFRDHHVSNGNTMADWPAAWRTWVRNALKFNGKERSNGRDNRGVASAAAELIHELAAKR